MAKEHVDFSKINKSRGLSISKKKRVVIERNEYLVQPLLIKETRLMVMKRLRRLGTELAALEGWNKK